MIRIILLVFSISLFSYQIASAAQLTEQQIKQICLKEPGGGSTKPGSPYQNCLRRYGIIRVEANVNSGDTSKTDAIVCNVENPTCKKCLNQYAQSTIDARTARTNVMNCISAENAKLSSPKSTATSATGKCSGENVEACASESSCSSNGGGWNSGRCEYPSCGEGLRSIAGSKKECLCPKSGQRVPVLVDQKQSDALNNCPESCMKNSTFNRSKYMCECNAGFVEDFANGDAVCVASDENIDTDSGSSFAKCMQELQDDVSACSQASDSAVKNCDVKKDENASSKISALQGILNGVNGYIQAKNAGSGAVDNCLNAAVASSTGYYALEALKKTCESEINSCKSKCEDAEINIHANRNQTYLKCRKVAFQEYASSANGSNVSEAQFNTEFDRKNRSGFEQQLEQMENNVAASNEKCDGGIAITNREKMKDFMTEMNTSVKNANLCGCQLSSAGKNCAQQVGPAECGVNPNLPGCALATVNCAMDNTPRCICFRAPNSQACKNFSQVGFLKQNGDLNKLSAFGGSTTPSSMAIGGNQKPGGNSNIDLGDLSTNEAAPTGSATATADMGSPFGSGDSGGGGGGGGGLANSLSSSGGGNAGDASNSGSKGIGGFFDTAKSALNSLFKKDDKSKNVIGKAYSGKNSGSGSRAVDPSKWRPKGSVRGVASDNQIAGKFEDIWKVMNRQYKSQDQKNSFLFGTEVK